MNTTNDMQLTSNGIFSPVVSTNPHLSSWNNWGLNLASANFNDAPSFLASIDKNQYSLLKNSNQNYPTITQTSSTTTPKIELKTNTNNLISAASSLGKTIGSLFSKTNTSKFGKGLASKSEAISSGIDTAGSLLTGVTKQSEDKTDQGVSMAANTVGDIAMAIPTPVTFIGGALAKTFGYLNTSIGPTVKGTGYYDLANNSSSYTGIKKYGNKKFGLTTTLFGGDRRQRNRVAGANAQLAAAQGILEKSKWDPNQSKQMFATGYNNAVTGTNSLLSSQNIFGKEGMKVKSVKELVEETKHARKMKSGGKFNVIPDGALHARLNNMSNEELEGNITKKGIPVIVKGAEGIKQVAEIEKNEIILHKDVVDKLEQYRKDKNALDAGKLLVEEILRNTVDNTGLLKTVE